MAADTEVSTARALCRARSGLVVRKRTRWTTGSTPQRTPPHIDPKWSADLDPKVSSVEMGDGTRESLTEFR